MSYSLPADAKGHMPNCGPTSVAVLAGVTVHKVMTWMRGNVGKPAKWKGSTHNRMSDPSRGDCWQALDHFGLNPVFDADLNERVRGCAIKTAAKALPTGKAYLIITGSHAQAVVNGRVFDQNSDGVDMADYWGKNKKVFRVITCDMTAAPKRKVYKLILTRKSEV